LQGLNKVITFAAELNILSTMAAITEENFGVSEKRIIFAW